MKHLILELLGGWRRRSLIAGTLAVVAGGVFAISAMGVHNTGAFELEGNATNDPAVAGDDWDNVCRAVLGTNCSTTTGVGAANTAVSWVSEPNLDATIFTGGGSKDPKDIDEWAWKDGAGGLPAKDNLLHGFAARYSLPSTGTTGTCPTPVGVPTCEMLFFGSDRWDNSGDATQGFWFFQDDNVGLGSNSIGGGTGFTGLHENGDLLALTDFSNGGGTSTIFVYEWDDTCPSKANNNPQPGQCGDTNLRLLASSTNANCAGPHGNFCGIVNSGTITMPWSFTDKSNTPNNGALNGEFFEGGINLSQLGLGGTCFANFASESRASTSTDATLKDFVLAEFAPCEAEMTTQVSDDSVIPGEPVHDTATVVGSNPAITPTGTVTFFMCTFGANSTDLCDDSDAAHEGVSIGTGTLSGMGATASADSPAVNTAASPLTPGRYCFRAEWPGDANYPQDPSPLVHFEGPECFTVAKLPSNTVTTPVDGSGTPTSTITLGSSIFDRAVVTGEAAGGDPLGDVNFFVCGPIAAPATCTTGGTAVQGNPKSLVSDGVADTFTSSATSGEFTPTAVGRYCFRAEYLGSNIYLPSSDSGANECFTVTDTTATATHQVWLPNDQATITSAHGAPISGTLSFTLHAGGDCTGTVLRPAETFTLDGAASPVNRSTTNQTVTVEQTATVSWEVVFTSTNPFVSGSSRCETTSLTITN